MRKLIVTICTITFLFSGCIKKEKKQDKYTANWESLTKYKIPEWFQDAKFGIFIHWGVYSVPAYDNEWYPRHMYQDSMLWHQTDSTLCKKGTSSVYTHHIETYGHPSKFGYKDFIQMFKAEKFHATQWVDLFKRAGAKYIVPVAEHHDGFAMYRSHVTRWNAFEMGPKRDIIGELSKATKDAGLKFGVSSHFAFNWDYFNHEDRFDTSNPDLADLYGPAHQRWSPVSEEFKKLWWRRTTDIIDSYKPDLLWFDFYWDRNDFAPYHPKLAAYYYNMGEKNNQEVVLQSKNMGYESFPEGIDVLDIERGKRSNVSKFPWQTDTSIGENSWCYIIDWKSKSVNSIIDDLVDIVSKNGNLLLNVGPKADGTIPQDQIDVLLGIGDWLRINGEAIYETKPWIKFGEGPTIVQNGHHSEGNNKDFTSEDIRFTTKEKTLYAIVLDVPVNGQILVKSLAGFENYSGHQIKSIELLGETVKLRWDMTADGLLVKIDGVLIGKDALVMKISI